MRYREVIHPPLWLLAIIYFFLLSLVVSIWAALGDKSALFSLVTLTALLLWLYFSTALIIEIDDHQLRVGKAHIGLEFIGTSINLDNEAIRRVRTRDANPLAFLALRFWAPKGVQISINDDRDKTPYWLVSSKNGLALITALKNES